MFGTAELGDDQVGQLVDLTQQAFLVVERELKLTSFWESVPARNRLKAEIQQILVSAAFMALPKVVANRNWNIVRAQMPAMEKAKAWLKTHGVLLEQEL